MKRKVIQIANSTQLISLPRKWSMKYGVKKGDELEVEEQGNTIVLSTEEGAQLGEKEINVTGLDRTTIIYYLQALYRVGYDEIKVVFNEPTAIHFRTNKKINIISIIHTGVDRLIGYEVVQQKENFCLIKNISKSSIQEFDSVLRRIYLLLNDTSSDLAKEAKEMNLSLIETIEEKHASITKFISYCLRLLNKYGHHDHKKTIILFHIISSLDRVIDVLRDAGRDLLKIKHKLNGTTIQFFNFINQNIQLHSELFFKFDLGKVVEIYKNRNEMLNQLYQFRNKVPPDELVLSSKLEHIFELLIDINVSRMGLGD